MIVDEELELTTESALLREIAEALHDLAAVSYTHLRAHET